MTPLECERLQGFPDEWTNIPSASDSAHYKALGNSVAIPCVEFIMGGIARILKAENEKRRRRGWIIILAFLILGGNMFTPGVIWSLATCGLCIILLVIGHNEPWKRED